ncbi:MAG: DUF1080 domain-containing protein [Cytophagaceae bacterium]|jgi:hypothetical protein|nr:DUF1080 domain-containing protein [Cytophagaceae bacterium]
MKIFFFALLIMFCANASAQKTVQLFNGKNLDNWKIVLSDNSKQPHEVFFVSEEVLHVTGTPFGYIRTLEKYKNFELTLEWRWAEEPANSGVLLHIAESDTVWPHCIEAQLQHQNAGNFVLMNAGAKATINGKQYWINDGDNWVSSISRTKNSSEKPVGEWNRYRIVSNNGQIWYYVNDVLQNSAEQVSPFGGFIGLQSEGGTIQFKNIEINKFAEP